MALTLGQVLAREQSRLVQALSLEQAEARLEAQILLSGVLKKPRAYLLAHQADVFPPDQEACYLEWIERRLSGEPVAYILGEREFYGLVFKITHAVLIPRPETELLVELALARILDNESQRVLDLGTGSGAVAIALAKHRPYAAVTAVDQSAEALAIAQENAVRLEASNLRLLQSDWFGALDRQQFDIIVSNPPYVAKRDPHLEQGDLRFEPTQALVGGADGLECIRRIVEGAPQHLNHGGWLLFEHGFDQAERSREMLLAAGFAEVFSAPDLAGILRVSGGKMSWA